MRTHSNDFKNGIKNYGRQFTDNIQSSYTDNGSTILVVISPDKLNRVEYSVDTQLFKSIMGKLTFDTNQKLDDRCEQAIYYIKLSNVNDTDIKFKGNITQIEEQKDSKSYLYTCYDNMIKTMVDYETPKVNGTAITYPITIRNYLSAICSHLGISFGSGSDNFTNYNKEIKKELYVDSDGKSLGYTFRDVLDDIAEATGSFIYVDYYGTLKVKSIYNTNDTINEDYFKDKNVNVGKKVGPYNVVVLSRANDSDNLYYPQTLPQNPIEFKISDNLILEQDTREDFIQGIYNAVNGLEFYTNDFATNGILYYEIGDKFNVSIGGVTYPCLMLSDDIIRTTGLKENIRTTEPQQSVTPYKYASYSDKVAITSKNAKILVDKANASIEQIVEAVGDNGEVTTASIVQSINDSGSQIKLNADKVYINGVTFDENQNMTMTDGTIALEDNPETEVIPSISITTSSDNNSKIGLWSKKISSSERYEDYTTSNRYVEGYGLSHNKQTGSTWADLITQFRLGRGTEYSSASSGNFYQFREGIEMYHIRSYSGADYSSSSTPHSVIRIWDKNDTSNPVVEITEKEAIIPKIFASNSVKSSSITAGFLESQGSSLLSGSVTLGDKLIIPKDGNNNKGIYDENGDPIIRDWQNNNVSVDATGGTLWLGYQNTTGLNILNGKFTIVSNGDIYNKTFDLFNDTNGSNWQVMLKNKLDYCINNIDTNKTNTQAFINGGWQGNMFGFGIFSKINTTYQLVWFSQEFTGYVIKYGSTYTYKLHRATDDYSESESLIGTWINGKPLYRKVVKYNNTSTIGSSSSVTNISIPHGVSNIGQVTKCDIAKATNHIFPILGGSGVSYGTCVTQVDTTNINLRIINDTWGASTWYFILEYTKSTD